MNDKCNFQWCNLEGEKTEKLLLCFYCIPKQEKGRQRIDNNIIFFKPKSQIKKLGAGAKNPQLDFIN